MLSPWFTTQRQYFDSILPTYLPTNTSAARLINAMHYSLIQGGKRLRPLFVYATAVAIGQSLERFDPLAVAIEYIHTYSLIHDDLPAMDDDDLRRGQPTCHKAFDEATAILAGDALLTHAFRLLTTLDIPAQQSLMLIRNLSEAAGAQGMVGGQMLDMQAEHHENISPEQLLTHLEKIHALKTGALINSCVNSVTLCSPVNQDTVTALQYYANHIGLAFQIQDDILDATETSDTLGKSAGKDQAQRKLTYATVLGIDDARHLAYTHYQKALAALQTFDKQAAYLRELAEFAIRRNH